ncbi:MAG TPA: hypothetical protein VHA56_07055 [Mucilaginibacter sp.]|nr:hypothetical protein [Mucilaginibacter sp.]
MKIAVIISLLVLGLGHMNPKTDATLNGTWQPVKEEFGGKPWPAAMFENQKLVIADSLYTFYAESVDKGRVTYGDGKMDIYGMEGVNTGKHFMAIYKHEDGQLTICYNLKGDGYPEAFATKPQTMLFLSVFKKAE